MNTHSTAVSAIVAEIQGLCNEAKIDEKAQRGPKAVFKPSFIVTIVNRSREEKTSKKKYRGRKNTSQNPRYY